MKIAMRNLLSGVAAMSVALGAIGAAPAGAVETGQILDNRYCSPWPSCKVNYGKKSKGKPDTTEPNPVSAAEKQLCGLPHTPPCRADAPATDIETGQKLDKPRPPSAQRNK